MSTKKTKISMPIKDLKTDYEQTPHKIKQEVEGLNPITIRAKKIKQIDIDNPVIKKSKSKKFQIFDEGIKRTYRRKNKLDDDQKYRAYKSNTEQKLYESFIVEPEQSVVEAIKEAVSQLKTPNIKKLLKDANAENKHLDTSEIISHHDVVQPKTQEEKRATLLDAVERRAQEAKRKEEALSTLSKTFKHRKERKTAQAEAVRIANEKANKLIEDKDNALKTLQAVVRSKSAQNNINEQTEAAKRIQKVVRNKSAHKPRHSIAPSEISNAPTEITPENRGKGGRPKGSFGEKRIKNIIENRGKNHEAAVDSVKFAKYKNKDKEPPSYKQLRNYYNFEK
jgi:hypothetical protein